MFKIFNKTADDNVDKAVHQFADTSWHILDLSFPYKIQKEIEKCKRLLVTEISK